MIWLELRFDGHPVDNILVHCVDEALDIIENHSYKFDDQNEELKEWWLSEEGMNPNPIVDIVYTTHTDKKCPRCGEYLFPPDVKGYQYTCYNCDENFYECEVNKMKKYTLKEWEEFCKEALIIPPFEDDEQIEEWFDNHKIYITANDCVMELEYDADAVNEIEFALKEIYEAILGDGTPTTGNTIVSECPSVAMTDVEFKAKLDESFKTHMFTKGRNHHTVNELMYVLQHDSRFNGEDFNVSIRKLNGEWWSVPTLGCFVSTSCLSVWFDDDRVEFEIEECGAERYNCITVYERKDK